mmetsp:Transcript_28520/g.58172  ORF Transcript_28520/g.58172 Transcript_28520/m.58172 type:complete len:203 (-) Transcript_28520:204-812(-)
MPVGHIFVRDTRGNVKHDDGTLALDVVSIAQSPKFLLPGGVPHVEFNGSTICVEDEGVDLYSQGGHIFFLKLSGQVPLDESCFSNSSVSDEDQLKFWHFLLRSLKNIACDGFIKIIQSQKCQQNQFRKGISIEKKHKFAISLITTTKCFVLRCMPAPSSINDRSEGMLPLFAKFGMRKTANHGEENEQCVPNLTIQPFPSGN